ncbi:hypothetical protein H257_04668 [Aphanomyces astaci]|uniref:Uncharacterized protein n=1 Tax=Aphanomyces astaci TaxID=112090 RepID=W4GVE1_APHAT|nr:hypothetical protein H257_04668 [Aphanomyces astaci]ETV82893.1 hypothetical protein H257_04668 [Aphanomyces astaci]|eukprot:XP_009827564.1 hypothetical protein H257_04668 [Aphanomyces astaci]
MGDVVRVSDQGPVDPLERGPPKRVGHMVENVGSNIASSKKRASWKFTFGDSDKVHEVVLLHSVMSAKKVVEYDGREKYHVALISPGDWSIILMLEHRNTAIEVRINEFESPDMPRYDLLIDRAPFRKMDVYRRNNKKLVGANGSQGNAYQPASGHGHIQQGGYHQSHWGPGDAASDVDDDHAPVVPCSEASYSKDKAKSTSTKKTAPPPEINLIDTSIPEITPPVHSIVFDPLVTGPAPPAYPTQAASPVNLNGIFNAQQVQPQQRSFAPPSFDPFASLQPQPNKQPLGYFHPQQQTGYGYPTQQYGGHYANPTTPLYPAYNNIAASPIYPPQQQQQQYYAPPLQQQQPNLNISTMMNPMQVQHSIQPKKPTGQDININPFSGMR